MLLFLTPVIRFPCICVLDVAIPCVYRDHRPPPHIYKLLVILL